MDDKGRRTTVSIRPSDKHNSQFISTWCHTKDGSVPCSLGHQAAKTHRCSERQNQWAVIKACMSTAMNNSATSANDNDTGTTINASKNNGDTQDRLIQSALTKPTPNAQGNWGMNPSKTTKENGGTRIGNTTARAGREEHRHGKGVPTFPPLPHTRTRKTTNTNSGWTLLHLPNNLWTKGGVRTSPDQSVISFANKETPKSIHYQRNYVPSRALLFADHTNLNPTKEVSTQVRHWWGDQKEKGEKW